MKYPYEQLKEAHNKLPDALKEAIDSPDIPELMLSIRDEFKLTIDQMAELSRETGNVLLGFTRAENFLSEIEDALAIPPDMATSIVRIVDEQVFRKVREHLQKRGGTGKVLSDTERTNPPRAPLAPQPVRPLAPVASVGAAARPLQTQRPTGTPLPTVKGGATAPPVAVPRSVAPSAPVPPPSPQSSRPTAPTAPDVVPTAKPLIEQKLSAPFSAPATEVRGGNGTQAEQSSSVAKIDPYRESVE